MDTRYVCIECKQPVPSKSYLKGWTCTPCRGKRTRRGKPKEETPKVVTRACKACGMLHSRRTKRRLSWYCGKTCESAAKRVKHFDITPAQFIDLYEGQEGACGICGKRDELEYLDIDHDHRTDKVRGLLCRNCNIGLGHFHDSPRKLAKAIQYLGGDLE